MKKSTDVYNVIRSRIYPLRSTLDTLYSNRVNFLFLSLLLVLSFICFKDILRSDVILVHGDLRYALTVHEHLFHLLSNLPVHAAKLPLSLILYPLQTILGDNTAEKVFTILILFLAASFAYFANKLFVRRFEGRGGYWLSSSCFIGSLVFFYNPWTLNKIHHHYWLVLSLAASYLLIATIDDYLRSREQKGRKQLLIIAISTSLVATQFHGIIIYFMPMLIIYLVISIVLNRSAILSKPAVKKIALLTAVTLACSLFWLFPVIEALTTDRISQGFGFVTYEISRGFVTYGIVHENVDQLSRRSTIHAALQGTGDWTWGQGNAPDPSIKINNIDLWETVALLPLVFIFLFFIIRRPIGKSMIYIIAFFSALIILSVILATGSYYNDIYKRVFLDFPLGESLRDPYKFTGLYFVAISFFASATLYRLERKGIRKNIAVILLFVGLILSWGWIGLTGNLNGHLTQSLLPYPRDLFDVSEFLHRQYEISSGANGSIFWYPTGTERTQLQYSSVPELSTESLPHLRLPPFQLNYIDDLINKNDDTSFIRLLEYLGVQYLVTREDYKDNDDNSGPESLQEIRTQMQNVKTVLQGKKVFESGRFAVYKLSPSSSVSVSHLISAGTDDLSRLAKVIGKTEYLNNNIQLGPFLEDSLIVSDLPPPEPLESATITVHPTSEHFLPTKYWSTGAINGGWLNTILPYLNSSGIRTWQFDYNKGFIFSLKDNSDEMVEDSISIPFKVNNNNNNYKVFVRYLESLKGGLISTDLEGNLIEINTLSTDSKLVWKDLGDYTLSQGSHSMTFTNRGGFNAINAILLIQKDQFEEINGQIEDWLNRNNTIIVHNFEAESDIYMSKPTIMDKTSSGNDKVVSINGTAWKQFDVKKEGNYRIWIDGSGLFSVIIDDHKEIVNATMNRPIFSDSFKLKEGNSRLEVTPLQEPEKLKVSDYQDTYLVANTSNSIASRNSNVIDSIWLVSDSNHLHDLFDDDAIVLSNQMQTATSIPYKVWSSSSSQRYELQLNNITAPLMISIAEPFNANLKAAIYTKDGLSRVENLVPLFYSLKSGIYLNSLPADARVVVYASEAPIEWFAISVFFSVASYALLVLSANAKLANRLKDFVHTLNSHLMKQKSKRNSH